MSFLTVSESSHPFSTWKSQAIFSIGFFWTLRGGRKSPLRPLAQVAPSMYKGRLLLWLRAIRYPLNPLAAQLGSLLQKRRPASALPFGPWFDAWHGQHWPFSVGSFGKSWSLVCSIWKINDAMHFDGRNVEQVTETSAPCSILSIVTTLFCFCWRVDFPCSILSSSILQCKECLRGKRAHQFSKSHLENDFQTISVVHSEIANAMSEPNYCTCDSVWCTHKTEACLVFFFWFWHPCFPYSCFIIFHVFYCFFLHVSVWFPCRVHQATGVLQWAPCRKQPSLWANRAELPMRKIPIFVGQKCKSQVLQPLFALKQSGPSFFFTKSWFHVVSLEVQLGELLNMSGNKDSK